MSDGQLPEHPHVAEIIEHMHDHPDPSHVRISDQLDHVIRVIGNILCWVNGLLIFAILSQVVLRYAFDFSQPWLDEFQWHLYAVAVMFGVSYAQVNDAHIRVDVLHMRFSDRAKRVVEIIGIVIFVLPFVYVIIDHSIDFVNDAIRTDERSDSPLGLPYRWIIKSVIPVSFGLFALASISRLIRDVVVLVRGND